MALVEPRVLAPDFLRITPSGEIYLKSRQTRPRFLRILTANLESGLSQTGVVAKVVQSGHHELRIETDHLQDAASVSERTFGVAKIEHVREMQFGDLDGLAVAIADLNRRRVSGHTFAVRVRRSGKHSWSSRDAARIIGALLLDDSAGVNLDDPEVTVRVVVRGDTAMAVLEAWEGPHGLPLGTQDRALVLLSGGIDSPVAGWMMMRRGCPADLLHFKLDCAQSDHALSVGYELVDRWGHGSETRMHVLDFQPVKEVLYRQVRSEYRQIALKKLMVAAAGCMAQRLRIPMLVTGDSLGQVSSQTSAHLVVIDRFSEVPILRPLVAFSKDEIVQWSHRIGTYELSIRAREVCDLSGGRPVVTAATARQLSIALEGVDPGLIEEVLATWETIEAHEWHPGVPLQPAA
jgi:thiamine biosynthesis protein ThiI